MEEIKVAVSTVLERERERLLVERYRANSEKHIEENFDVTQPLVAPRKEA